MKRPKREVKQFPVIEFRLTKHQKKKLAGFAEEIDKGYIGSNGDRRRATFANISLARGGNEVQVFLISPPQTTMIQRAVMRARKTL